MKKGLYSIILLKHPSVLTDSERVRAWLRLWLREISLASSSGHRGQCLCQSQLTASANQRPGLLPSDQSEGCSEKIVVIKYDGQFKFKLVKTTRRDEEAKVEMLSQDQSLQLLVIMTVFSITSSISAGPLSSRSERYIWLGLFEGLFSHVEKTRNLGKMKECV